MNGMGVKITVLKEDLTAEGVAEVLSAHAIGDGFFSVQCVFDGDPERKVVSRIYDTKKEDKQSATDSYIHER